MERKGSGAESASTFVGRRGALMVMVGAALMAAMVTLSAAGYRNSSLERIPVVEVVAHRAGAALGPENTVAALEQSIAAGVGWAEIDVQMTADGVAVVLHDGSLERTTGLRANVWQTDMKTMKQLDAGGWYSPAFAGERLATLEEMAAAARGRIRLMVEVKSDGPYARLLLEHTVTQIQTLGQTEEWTLASADANLLSRSKQLRPELSTLLIGVALPEDMQQPDVDGYSIQLYGLTAQTVAQAKALDKKVYAWTVNTPQEIQRALALGVDGLVTDQPVLTRQLAQAAGYMVC